MFKESVKTLLLNGCNIDFCKVSISYLNQFMERDAIQVHSDNPLYLCSHIYKLYELDIAVARFCFITRLIKNEHKRQSEKLQTVRIEE